MTHQPVYAGIRQGEKERGRRRPTAEHQARCTCGWTGHWVHRWDYLYAELADHLREERRPV